MTLRQHGKSANVSTVPVTQVVISPRCQPGDVFRVKQWPNGATDGEEQFPYLAFRLVGQTDHTVQAAG